MKSRLILKLLMLSIVGTLCINSIAPVASVFALERNNSIIQNDNLQFENYTKYIGVVNNKYVLNDCSKELSGSEIAKIQHQLDFTNGIIQKYGITSISVKDGFSVYINNQDINDKLKVSEFNVPLLCTGVTKVQFYWWGFYLYLDSYWTGLALTAGIGGIVGGIGAILGEGVGAGIALGVASSIVNYVFSNSKLAQRGCIVSYNYALGVQKIWAQ